MSLDGLYGPTLLAARIVNCVQCGHDGKNECLGCVVDLWILRSVFRRCLVPVRKGETRPCDTLDCGQ